MSKFLALVVLALTILLVLRATVFARNPVRRTRWRIRFRLRPGPEFASIAEIQVGWSRLAAVYHGRRARPDLTLPARLACPATAYAVRLGRAQWFRCAYARMEDQTLILAPPRTGKTGQLADRIYDHPGAVLNITTRADVYNLTAGRRAPDEITAAARQPGASLELFAAAAEIQREGRSADSVRLTMTKSLAWIAVPALLDLVTGPCAVPFDAGAWALRGGTIYLIAPNGNNSAAAPLFRCFLEHLHYDAALAGTRMRHGRLPIPVFLALDEVTQTVSPPLAQWLADSAGKGILISFVCHSTGQLAERYGDHAARAIWSLAATKLFLPGISDPATLDDVSKLCGTTGPGQTQRPVCPPELLRRLPENRALVIAMNRAPLVIKFRPIWKRITFRLHLNPAPPALQTPTPLPEWDAIAAELEPTAPSWPDIENIPADTGGITGRYPDPGEGDDDQAA